MNVVSELRRLLAEATPGEWDVLPEIVGSPAFIRSQRGRPVATTVPMPDAALIVALRNHAGALLDVADRAEAAEARVEALTEALDGLVGASWLFAHETSLTGRNQAQWDRLRAARDAAQAVLAETDGGA